MSRIVKKTPHLHLIHTGSALLTSDLTLLRLFEIDSAFRKKSQLVLIGGPQGEARFMTILVGDVSEKNWNNREQMML